MEDDPTRNWTEKDHEEMVRPKTFGNFALALFPAVYCWQLYGWVAALIFWFVVATILTALSWGMFFGKIRPVVLWWLKAGLIAVSFLGLGLSAMEAGHY